MAYKIEVELTDLEAKAWHVYVADGQEWVEMLVRHEVRRCMLDIHAKETERMIADPEITQIPASIEEVVAGANLISAKQRNEELLAEMQERMNNPNAV